jgi:hypothetical protein
MLADIYNWFTEGFDTADLKDAKALLEDLSARHYYLSMAADGRKEGVRPVARLESDRGGYS